MIHAFVFDQCRDTSVTLTAPTATGPLALVSALPIALLKRHALLNKNISGCNYTCLLTL